MEKDPSTLDNEDVLDAYERQVQQDYAPKKSGKGGKAKKHGQNTLKHIAETATANRIKRESHNPSSRIDGRIESFLLSDEAVNRKQFKTNLRLWLEPKDRRLGLLPHLDKYQKWLLDVLIKHQSPVTSKQIKETFVHSSGPGGQNVNKVNSAVNLLHLPSLILVHAESSRDQIMNRQLAQELLLDEINSHLNDWHIFIQTLSPDSPEDLQLIILEKIKDQVRATLDQLTVS